MEAAPSELTPSRNGLPDPARSGRQRVIEIQRARMLAAMTDVCVELGGGNVTVAHVVERAGVSRRTFYEIFDDREDCFLAAFDEGLAKASRYVLDAYDPDVGWAERIRTALGALLEFLDVERDTGRLLIVESPGGGASVLERRRRLLAQIVTVIDMGRTEARMGREPPPLTAEGIVGGVLSVLHSRMLDYRRMEEAQQPPVRRGAGIGDPKVISLLRLTGPLMSMIMLPYLGMAAAQRELERPAPRRRATQPRENGNPLRELEMRLTYRTVRVLMAVAAQPGGSNRQLADAAGITDQGQISKLLARLHGLGLIENTSAGSARGASNAWTLTAKGWEVEAAIMRNSPTVGGV